MVFTHDYHRSRSRLLAQQSPKLGGNLDAVREPLLRDPKAGNQFAPSVAFFPVERAFGFLNRAAVGVRKPLFSRMPAESTLTRISLNQRRLGRRWRLRFSFLRFIALRLGSGRGSILAISSWKHFRLFGERFPRCRVGRFVALVVGLGRFIRCWLRFG